MVKNIKIISRAVAEEMTASNIGANTAIISFFTPPSKRHPAEYDKVDYEGLCNRVYYVGIHDIDIETLGEFNLTFDTYFPETNALAEFIIKAIDECDTIICQCEYGQSRSAACAAAIKEYINRTGIEIFADYRYYPNQLVFNKMFTALRKFDIQSVTVPSL